MQFLAVFFVLFVLADVTALQAYSGNETVRISFLDQQLKIENQISKKVENPVGAKAVTDIQDSSHGEQTPEPYSSKENCLGCCSHILLGFNPAELIARQILPAKLSTADFSYHRPQSDSHLPQIYQPPKFI